MPTDATRTAPATDADLVAAMTATVPDLTDRQVTQLLGYRDRLFETNQHLNLTAVRDRQGIGQRLVLESLRLVPPLRAALADVPDPTAIDLGTGGGIPGAVLAIAQPDLPFTLLDATRKKLDAVQAILDDLEVTNANTLHGRAEEVAHDPRWRARFAALTARAVSSLPALVELGLPLLRMQGTMLLPKGVGIEDELRAGRVAAGKVGGRVVEAPILPANGSCIDTTLVVVKKTRTTPASYPRRSGLPARQPLGGPS